MCLGVFGVPYLTGGSREARRTHTLIPPGQRLQHSTATLAQHRYASTQHHYANTQHGYANTQPRYVGTAQQAPLRLHSTATLAQHRYASTWHRYTNTQHGYVSTAVHTVHSFIMHASSIIPLPPALHHKAYIVKPHTHHSPHALRIETTVLLMEG